MNLPYDLQSVTRRIKDKYIVTSSGCWLWTGSKNNDGYARIRVNNKIVTVSRVTYEIYKGEIPKTMCVCHSCDTPGCINPEHLFIGSRKDNTMDMLKKERAWSKLSATDVITIREAISSGIKRSEIKRRFDISYPTISKIHSRTLWKHL